MHCKLLRTLDLNQNHSIEFLQALYTIERGKTSRSPDLNFLGKAEPEYIPSQRDLAKSQTYITAYIC